MKSQIASLHQRGKVPREIIHAINSVPNIIPSIHQISMPKRVYLCSSGPNGAEFLPSIPKEAFKIGCNTIITYPNNWNWWIAFDHRMLNYGWWNDVEIPNETKLLFGSRLVNRLNMLRFLEVKRYRDRIPHFYFDYLPNFVCPTKLHPKWVKTPKTQLLGLAGKKLRGGLTVSGVGIQFAAFCGVKELILCGIDMKGAGHFDGFINPDPHGIHKDVWPYADLLSDLCEELQKRYSMKIYSLSETALRVPRWKE